jgi:glycosyltransferase involved in cell wall biosynthesis
MKAFFPFSARWRARLRSAGGGGETPLNPAPDLASLAALGYPALNPPPAAAATPERLEPSGPAGPEVADKERRGLALVTVCTRNHLHFARVLVSSFAAHHPEAQRFVIVADADDRPLAVAGATVLAGRSLVGGAFDYLALKYSATDLCCALKPFGLAWVLRHTRSARVVYLDADVCVFAPLAALLEALDGADFVVTPHTLAPMPRPERFWERPTLGDLAYAGPLNAGMFGLRAGDAADGFLRLWTELVSVPGAFLESLGGQKEQNAFNWITCFATGIYVLRDPAYNVAYWNLHDRSLRWTGLDDPSEERWLVNGRPLVAFHFSGLPPAGGCALSRWDGRYSLYVLPSVARLVGDYRRRLDAAGAAACAAEPYGFAAFPSGVPIDDRMRRLFREHETFLRGEANPWTPEGERHYCTALLSPVPYSGGQLPLLFDEIYGGRPDLVRLFPDARLRPDGFMRWLAAHGIHEYDYREIYERHRPARPNRHGAVALTRRLRDSPALFAGLRRPLGRDRMELLARLEARADPLAAELREGELEHYRLSAIRSVRHLWRERPDVRRAFPDPLDADAPAFASWLAGDGVRHHFLAEDVPATFAAKAQGRGMARVFSYLNRNWRFMQRWPLALVGVDADAAATALLGVLRSGLEYDLEDVMILLWTLEERPWAGLGLTFELAANARRKPSPLLPEGQERLLAPVIDRPGFRRALAAYRAAHDAPRDRFGAEYARRYEAVPAATATSVADLLKRRQPAPRPSADVRRPPGAQQLLPGVNLVGYHKSPIGLGALTRGLDLALGAAGIPTAAVTLGNVAMDRDLAPADFVRRYDHRLAVNVFVSYPHLHEPLLEAMPDHVTRGRHNVVYLAWEQRDGTPDWQPVYAGFDQIWALSDFAARALARFTGREVLTVPPVVDFDGFPEPVTPTAVGVDPGRFTFLYVFDANSSIERKNPEAAIAAFARAFSPSEPAELLLRVANADRAEHRERLERLLSGVPRGTRVRVLRGQMTHRDLLRLVSAVDCYVSLHRAEGFGYTCAEAMGYAKPVIASGYSGNLQFMSGENSFLVDCRECEVEVADGPFQRGSVWADPDLDSAAALMRRVYLERESARGIGRRAREDVRRLLSPVAVGRTVAAALSIGGGEVRWPDLAASALEPAAARLGRALPAVGS